MAGYIQAGDYVDVIASVVPRGGGSANVRTIYADVRVIRVGPATDSQAGQKGTGVSTSVRVAVSQCQAEFLDWFVTNRNLRFTLPSHEDYPPPEARPTPPARVCRSRA